MTKTPLAELLLPGQEYLLKAQEQYGFEVVEHPGKESSGDKARRLGWPRERIIKTVFFGYGKAQLGVVSPDFGKIDIRTLLGTPKPMPPARELPAGMEPGACTPWVTAKHFGDGIELYICDAPIESIVDVGLGQDARYSVQMPYGLVHRILEEEFTGRFGDRIRKTQVPFISKPYKTPVGGESYGR